VPRAARCELRQPTVVGGDAAGQEFQRDRLIEREVVGAIDFAHAAASEQGDQSVAGRRRSRPG